MMRIFQKSLYTLFFMVLLSGCGDETNHPKKYIEAYRLFIQEVTMSGRSYSELDWRSADVRNDLYSITYFQNLRQKLDVEEVDEVQRLNKRYLRIREKALASLYLKDFTQFVEEIERRGEDLSTEEWKVADLEFDEYYNQKFLIHREQFSKSQYKEFVSIGTTYYELRLRYGSDNLLEQASEGLDLAVDKVKDFIKDFN